MQNEKKQQLAEKPDGNSLIVIWLSASIKKTMYNRKSKKEERLMSIEEILGPGVVSADEVCRKGRKSGFVVCAKIGTYPIEYYLKEGYQDFTPHIEDSGVFIRRSDAEFWSNKVAKNSVKTRVAAIENGREI